AVRRIGAAIGRTVVEQCMQWIEADAVSAKMAREPDQVFEVRKISHAPVASGADSVKLHRDQPTAVEFSGERPLWRHDQGYFPPYSRSIGELQPVGTERQIIRPSYVAILGLTLGNRPGARRDLPPHRQPDRLAQVGPCGMAEADHHRAIDKAARRLRRKGP